MRSQVLGREGAAVKGILGYSWVASLSVTAFTSPCLCRYLPRLGGASPALLRAPCPVPGQPATYPPSSPRLCSGDPTGRPLQSSLLATDLRNSLGQLGVRGCVRTPKPPTNTASAIRPGPRRRCRGRRRRDLLQSEYSPESSSGLLVKIVPKVSTQLKRVHVASLQNG